MSNKSVKTIWDPKVDNKPESGSRMKFSHEFANRYFGNAGRILDVGCGIGSYTSLIDKESSFGIDLEILALKTARRYCTKSNFLVASILNLPFRDKTFDLIVLFEVIEHIPAKTELQAFAEVYRALTGSGALFMSTPNKHFISNILDPAFFLRGHRHYDLKKLLKLIAEIGFYVKESTKLGGWNTLIATNVFYFYKHILHKKGGKVYRYFDQKSDKEFRSTKYGFANLFIAATKANDIP
jgi:SAM-dependent methyltransferase